MKNVQGFNPMPEEVELRDSQIHGYGLFATRTIEAGHHFGITHIADQRFPDGYIRTALGSYANHSTTPNIKGVKDGDTYHFISIKQIKKGEELLVDYHDFNYDEEVLRGYK